MKSLIWYSDKLIKKDNLEYKGMDKFLHLFKIFGFGYSIIFDRSETLKLPIRVKNIYPLPKMRYMHKTYEEICNQRSLEIIDKSKELNLPIYVMYSGGIDSTVVLLSLINNLSEEDKNRLIVLLTENSINENPSFYRNFIKSKLKVISSSYFKEIIGTNNILVSGENNDQLFGGNILISYTQKYGVPKLHEKFSKDLLVNFFMDSSPNREYNLFYVEQIEKLGDNAPIKLTTNLDYLWWFIFTCRFQTAALKPFSYIQKQNYSKVNLEYLNNIYISFFASEDFQLWSMNNLDKKIGNTWNSYKQVCKEYIYKYNRDDNYYYNKTKFGSFWKVSKGNIGISFMNDSCNILEDIDLKEYYNEDNNFK